MPHSESLDIVRALIELGAIVVGAQFLSMIAGRFGIPAVVAQIVAGIIAGPTLFNALSSEQPTTHVLLMLIGELGALLLLFEVGLEIDLADLRKVGRAAIMVAIVGVALPLVGGWGSSIALGIASPAALLIGGALAATSVGITANVFGELRMLNSTEARVVLGAAVTDDVLGLIVLSIAVPIASGANLSGTDLLVTIVGALAFVGLGGWVATAVLPTLLNRVPHSGSSGDRAFAFGLASMLLIAAAAAMSGLAPIIGAVIAGAAVGRSRHAHRIADGCRPISALFVPVFFVAIGVDTDLRVLASAKSVLMALVLIVVAVIGKVLAGYAAGSSGADRLAVGLGMVPRGEVGLIFASVGRAAGVLDRETYAAVITAVLATTLLAPSLLRSRMRKVDATRNSLAPDDALDAAADIDAIIDLARRVSAGRTPDAGALRAVASPSTAPADWPASASGDLIAMIGKGAAAALRVLQVGNVFRRCLPAIDNYLNERQSTSFDLDPDAHLRFPTVERTGGIVAEGAAEGTSRISRNLVVAALIVDLFGSDAANDDGGAVSAGTQFAETLLSPDDSIRALDCVRNAASLARACDTPQSFSNDLVQRFAHDIGDLAALDDAVRLARALGAPHEWYDDALAEMAQEIASVIARAQPHGTVIDAARSAVADAALRVGSGPASGDQALIAQGRLAHISSATILREDPSVLAAAIAGVDPLVGPGRVRVFTVPGPGDVTTICVVTRNRAGIAARVCRSFAAFGLDISSATMASWGDGAWLGIFTTPSIDRDVDETADADETGRLVSQLTADIGRAVIARYRPTSLRPNAASPFGLAGPGSDITATVETSPNTGRTLLTITAPDRPALLADLAGAIETRNVRLSGASISTDQPVIVGESNDRRHVRREMVRDCFEIVHRRGGALSASESRALLGRLGLEQLP